LAGYAKYLITIASPLTPVVLGLLGLRRTGVLAIIAMAATLASANTPVAAAVRHPCLAIRHPRPPV
jgi:hypothetical protein